MALTSKWAELVALDEGIQLARRLNLQKVTFESDNAGLVNRIKRNGRDITIVEQYMYETCRNLANFVLAEVKWVPRNSNKIADFICNFALLGH
ncbi:hypothetical protein J1N35_041036 [Gossypium stocksii]|uniref:RNase H type-1 domain-containing protein n=1 Tax=Gossypium stocksii TaxID=47602 RepID=A0A9D3UFD0_9ROSI|nr:hypothetical protein J1N35_041036 [Gossypium stocksii]